jgi:endonuclease III
MDPAFAAVQDTVGDKVILAPVCAVDVTKHRICKRHGIAGTLGVASRPSKQSYMGPEIPSRLPTSSWLHATAMEMSYGNVTWKCHGMRCHGMRFDTGQHTM